MDCRRRRVIGRYTELAGVDRMAPAFLVDRQGRRHLPGHEQGPAAGRCGLCPFPEFGRCIVRTGRTRVRDGLPQAVRVVSRPAVWRQLRGGPEGRCLLTARPASVVGVARNAHEHQAMYFRTDAWRTASIRATDGPATTMPSPGCTWLDAGRISSTCPNPCAASISVAAATSTAGPPFGRTSRFVDRFSEWAPHPRTSCTAPTMCRAG